MPRPVSPVIPGANLPEILIGEGQAQYVVLPVYRAIDGSALSRWRLTWRERLQLLLTGNLYVSVLTFGKPFQPILIETTPPPVINDASEFTEYHSQQ
jgi:hypothetical protein